MTQIFYSVFMKEGRVKLICLALSIVLWGFVKSLKISTVKVNISLYSENMPSNMILTSRLPKFATLRLRGKKESLRFSTSNLKATLDLSSIKNGSNVLIPYFDKSSLPNRVDLESVAEVRVSCERTIQKKLWVKFASKGKPKQGYQVGRVMTIPNRITVSGPMSQLKNIYEVYTKKMNVENLRDNFKGVLPLVAPNRFISFVNEDQVNISVRIFQTSAGNKKILTNIPIDVLELNPNYNVVLNQEEVSIHLEGSREILEEVGIEDLKVFINLDNIVIDEIEVGEGKEEKKVYDENYAILLSVPVEVSLIRFQGKISVMQVKPSELQVNLSKKIVDEVLPPPTEKK